MVTSRREDHADEAFDRFFDTNRDAPRGALRDHAGHARGRGGGPGGRLRIFARDQATALFEGDAVTGPGAIVDDVPALGSENGAASDYLGLDGEQWAATLYTR